MIDDWETLTGVASAFCVGNSLEEFTCDDYVLGFCG
jgi:hypothetical protein